CARESLRLARDLGMKFQALDPIFCLAGTAVAVGDVERGARLAAAAEKHLSSAEHDAYDEARYRAVIERAKACDPGTWEQAAKGPEISLDEAADYALS